MVNDDKRVFVAYWFMVKIPFILTLLIQSILTPYGPFTCAVDKIKSEAGNGRSHWWRDASFLLGDRYCLRKVTLRSPPVVLFAIWGFLRGTVVEVPRAWILLRGRGILGMGPGGPGNPCFPTHSCGSCGREMVSTALSFSAGDMYSGERS